jgi:TRAP-type uncharacterized transport system substrate-binding protein/ABC-type amino acid transport system permease subunit
MLADFIGAFLSGFVTDLWIGGASLLAGLAVGCPLGWLRVRGGRVGKFASGWVTLCNATPTFIAMFVLLNLLPRRVAIFDYDLLLPMPTYVILSLGIYAAASISNSFVDAARHLQMGDLRAALLFLPNTTRVFIVLVLASSTAAAIGVPESVTVTLRTAELLPNVTHRVGLVVFALLMFTALIQALELAIRATVNASMPFILRCAGAKAPTSTDLSASQGHPGLAYQFLRYGWIGFIAVGVLAIMAWDAPTPPRKVYIATGAQGGSWHTTAERYKEIFAASGIDLHTVPIPNSAAIPAAVNSGTNAVSIGFSIAGIKPEDGTNLRSLGAIEYQPLFVFYRRNLGEGWSVENLRGRRLGLPPAGSATVALTMPVLNALNINASNTQIVNMTLDEQVTAITEGRLDAIAFMLRDDSPLVRRLLSRDDLLLVNFPQANAISLHFKQLRAVKMPADVVDLGRHIPEREISLVAGTSYVLVNTAIHPGVIWTMLRAMAAIHADSSILNTDVEFSRLRHPQLPLDPHADEFYSSGVPWIYRNLPLQLASIIDYYMAILLPLALLLPIIGWLGLPDVPDLWDRARFWIWGRMLQRVDRQVAETGEWSKANLATFNVIRQALVNLDSSARLHELVEKLERQCQERGVANSRDEQRSAVHLKQSG